MRTGFDWSAVQPWVEKAIIAIAILIITWILAKAAKWAAARLVHSVPAMRRPTGTGESVGDSIGKIVSLLIWLLGLIAILQVFALNNVLAPLQTLLDNIAAFIPRIIGAGLIFFVGLIVARLAKQLVETTLQTIDFDAWLGKAGMREVTGASKLSSAIGTVVFVLIIVPVSIAALDTLDITAVSAPATFMLEQILAAVPLVLGAAILLAIAFFIARWAGGLIEAILPELGFDRSIQAIGLVPAGISPSRVVSAIVTVALMLFAGIAATRLLNFPELSVILDQILELGGRVIFGSVVIVVGVLLANLIAGLIAKSTGDTGFTATMIRYLIIAVATFMGLTFMQIGEQIVVIAFTAFVASAAVASALAFGLGGRATAHKLLERWTEKRPGAGERPLP